MEKLSKPPLAIVTFRLSFPHSLRIAESRADFYEAIKQDYSYVVFPEIKQLQYDWSDCTFFSAKNNAQIRIATNYFSFETLSYQTSDVFWESFKALFVKFIPHANLDEIGGFILEYRNRIKLDEKVGSDFKDYFNWAFSSQARLPGTFVALEGNLYFKTEEGLLEIEFRPIRNQTTKNTEAIDFQLRFGFWKKCKVDNVDLAELKTAFDVAHKHIDDAFRNSLTENYFNGIR